MRHRAVNISYVCLLIVTTSLFIAAFYLNRVQYRASIQSAKEELREDFIKEGELLAERIGQREGLVFERFNDEASLAQVCLDKNLFVVQSTEVLPAAVKAVWTDSLDELSRAKAEQAFQAGIEALAAGSNETAAVHFENASRISTISREDLYKKIAACINVFDARGSVDLSRLFYMAHLLGGRGAASLTPAQQEFLDRLLDEKFTRYAAVKGRSAQLWEKAGEIEGVTFGLQAPYRVLVGDSMLSVDAKGMAYLFPPDWRSWLSARQPFRVGVTPPDAHEVMFHSDMPGLPSVSLWMTPEGFQSRKSDIQKRYRMGNTILTAMLLLTLALAAAVIRAIGKEQELASMKAGFISTVSHELRTPLSLIRLHAETLFYDRIGQDKLHDYYRTILVESERMTGLINNILDFSRMERGKHRIHLEPTDMTALSNKIIESFRFRLEKEGFTFRRDIEDGVNAKTDSLAFTQIAFNLLDNAIKYGGEAKYVEMLLSRQGSKVILCVKDRGMGVPASIKKVIFDEFVRAKEQGVASQRGSGIGLSVAKRLTEKLGGNITVADNKPRGSVFAVELPVV